MDMLKDIIIKSVASSDTVYRRGVKYYREGAVEHLESENDAGTEWTAMVYGTEDYNVSVKLNKKQNNVESYTCDCPAAAQYLGACKHVVAVLLAIQEEQESRFVSVKSPGLIKPGRETHNQDIPFNEHAFGAYLGSRPFAQSSFVRSRVGAVRRTQIRYL